jgi:hypothetical protein
MAFKITLVLASGRRIQAGHKDSVEVTEKLVREEYTFNTLKEVFSSVRTTGWGGGRERERNLSCSPHRKLEQKLKMVVPIS